MALLTGFFVSSGSPLHNDRKQNVSHNVHCHNYCDMLVQGNSIIKKVSGEVDLGGCSEIDPIFIQFGVLTVKIHLWGLTRKTLLISRPCRELNRITH